MDLRVPTLIKFLNRLKSGTAAGNKIYIKGNRRNNFRILKKVVYLVYYLKAILKRGTLNIQLRKPPFLSLVYSITTNESKFLLLNYGRGYRKPFLAGK